MITVGALTDHIESRFSVGTPTDHSRSVTGEPYVVIGMQVGKPLFDGIIEECEPREWSFDEETACFAALSCFNEYANKRKGRLFWRVRPHLEWNDKLDGCTVYMRLLISDRPIIEVAA